jgi:nucleoside-diphosphate-sugar epimerase
MVSHLIEDRACDVMVIDNLCVGRREFIHPRAHFEYADITGSEEYLNRLFLHYKTEYVFNYAAEPYIPTSVARPLHVFNLNAFGALKVINAAQEAGCEAILQISSAEIYGDCTGKISETSPVNPHSTYGAAKAAIDALVQIRFREAGTPVIALRQFNCVGERETHPYIVPEIITQLFRPSKVIRLGNNSERDFLYAGDAVRMAVELLEKGDFGEVYNLGSENCVRVYDLARLISDLSGLRATVEEDEEKKAERPWEIWHLQSDNAKIYSVIGERSLTSLPEALKRVLAYHGAYGRWVWEKDHPWNREAELA